MPPRARKSRVAPFRNTRTRTSWTFADVREVRGDLRSDVELAIITSMRTLTILVPAARLAACATQTVPALPASEAFAAHCASCHGPLRSESYVGGAFSSRIPSVDAHARSR